MPNKTSLPEPDVIALNQGSHQENQNIVDAQEEMRKVFQSHINLISGERNGSVTFAPSDKVPIT